MQSRSEPIPQGWNLLTVKFVTNFHCGVWLFYWFVACDGWLVNVRQQWSTTDTYRFMDSSSHLNCHSSPKRRHQQIQIFKLTLTHAHTHTQTGADRTGRPLLQMCSSLFFFCILTTFSQTALTGSDDVFHSFYSYLPKTSRREFYFKRFKKYKHTFSTEC